MRSCFNLRPDVVGRTTSTWSAQYFSRSAAPILSPSPGDAVYSRSFPSRAAVPDLLHRRARFLDRDPQAASSTGCLK